MSQRSGRAARRGPSAWSSSRRPGAAPDRCRPGRRGCARRLSNGRRERKPTRMPRSSASGESSACHSPSSAHAQLRRTPGVTDLLHGQHVRRDLGDHRRQRVELALEGLLVGRPALGPRKEQVLEVPGRDRQRHPSKACSCRRTAARSHSRDPHRRGARSGAARRARRRRGGCRARRRVASARARARRARAARAPTRGAPRARPGCRAARPAGGRARPRSRARSSTCSISQSASSSAQAAGSKSASPSRSAIARDARDLVRRAVQCSAASRMSALVAKCQVVEDSETPASAATRAVRDGGDALARDDPRRSRRRSPRGPAGRPRRGRSRPHILTSTFVLAKRVRAY